MAEARSPCRGVRRKGNLGHDSQSHIHTSRRLLATRLTQRNKREVKGSDVPEVTMPRVEHHCRDCGAKIPSDKERCSKCWKRVTRVNFRAGRKAAQRPESLAKRSATQRMHKQAIQNWKPSDLPIWLTRDVYVKRVQPALAQRREIPNTFSTRCERTVLLSYPGRQARPASTALAGAGEVGGHFRRRKIKRRCSPQ